MVKTSRENPEPRVFFLFDYPRHHGGVSRVLTIANHLTKNGYKVSLLGIRFKQELPWWTCKTHEKKIGDMKIKVLSANGLIPLLFFETIHILKHFLGNGVEVFFSYNPTPITCLPPLLIKKTLNFGWTVIYDDIAIIRDLDKLTTIQYYLSRITEDIVIKKADKIVVLTKTQAKYLEKRGANEKHVIWIPNIVDHKKVHKLMAEHQQGKNGDKKVVLGYVGSLHTNMGLEDMVLALKKLEDIGAEVTLLVVGSGEALGELKKLAENERVSSHVDFVGYVPHERVWEYYGKMDILLCPLRATQPNLAVDHMKLYEYLATGKPVVAAQVGNIPQVVRHGENGLLYQPGNPESLAENIKNLVKNPEKAERMGKNGIKTIEKKHDINVVGREWEKLCNDLLKKTMT